jgi:IS4 transposase
VAAIYKDRWQVELFFKALKQNRKVKTFVGTSANALQAAVERVAEVLLTQMDTVTRPATRTAT